MGAGKNSWSQVMSKYYWVLPQHRDGVHGNTEHAASFLLENSRLQQNAKQRGMTLRVVLCEGAGGGQIVSVRDAGQKSLHELARASAALLIPFLPRGSLGCVNLEAAQKAAASHPYCPRDAKPPRSSMTLTV